MCNKKFLAAVTVIALALIGAPAFAQVQSVEDIEAPEPQFQDHGGVTPWFWIGVQTVFSGGYNFETTAGGFRNYGGDNYTYASFNLAFVDSHYQTPKFYEVPRQLDPDAWTGHFVMRNFTTRINSWGGGMGTTGLENNAPAWLAEITGKGARIGFFTQMGNLIGGLTDSNRTDENNSKPVMRISGGNKVLNLGAGQLGILYYENPIYSSSASVEPYVKATTTYTTSNGAIMYTGYEKRELWNVYLTMLSEGSVNSDVGKDKDANKGFAGVIDFGVTPFGLFTDEEKPLTFSVTGNAIAGFNFTTGINSQQSVGFGLEGESGIWLGRDNLVLSPVVAFDGKIDANNEFFWKFGGGLKLQFSGMRWTSDDWGDIFQTTAASRSNFAEYRYENNKILKYAYAQAYAAYSEASDLNMVLRVEEPDGNLGFHDKLGFLTELRLYNLTEKTKDKSWEGQARVSWDFNISQFSITPYVRGYMNHEKVFKMRLGAYANFIPFTGFELAYTSANLNKNAETTVKPMSHYESIFDAGRIELIVILKSDDIRPQVPKRMSDWNYQNEVQHY